MGTRLKITRGGVDFSLRLYAGPAYRRPCPYLVDDALQKADCLKRQRTVSRDSGTIIVAPLESSKIGLVQRDVQTSELLIVVPFEHVPTFIQPSERRPVIDPYIQLDSSPIRCHVAVQQAEQLVQPLSGQGRHRLHVVIAGGLGEQCVPGSGIEQVDLVQYLD